MSIIVASVVSMVLRGSGNSEEVIVVVGLVAVVSLRVIHQGTVSSGNVVVLFETVEGSVEVKIAST